MTVSDHPVVASLKGLISRMWLSKYAARDSSSVVVSPIPSASRKSLRLSLIWLGSPRRLGGTGQALESLVAA